MPRKRSSKTRPLRELGQRVNKSQDSNANVRSKSEKVPDGLNDETTIESLIGIKSILETDDCSQASTSKPEVDNFATAALYDELDSFRQRWKRELKSSKQSDIESINKENIFSDKVKQLDSNLDVRKEEEKIVQDISETKKLSIDSINQVYAKAKKLFLTAVELEKDEMYHESIRYYKESMHLCPDIEKQIYREQCLASTRTGSNGATKKQDLSSEMSQSSNSGDNYNQEINLYDLITKNFNDDILSKGFKHCRPNNKHKSGILHISDLPHELLVQILRYVIGEDLALASLESFGLVCRGFYLLSRDPSVWRSICFSTWGYDTISKIEDDDQRYMKSGACKSTDQIDWRQMYLNRPRVNFDGVYISKTRYIRQGDVGFQDITYRPFHVIRYYRYIRFFPDRRVLILTTNEEPDIVVPIFRHTLNSKQFSTEFSAIEGTYNYVTADLLEIKAEKKCQKSLFKSILNNRSRQAQAHLFRQTPLSQKFDFKFEVKTSENKPYKNNVLKWIEYTMFTEFETGQEVTSFDISSDTFPNLIFSRVKRLNMKLTKPLSSH